tara:strand:- start:580 stop:1422 length:843 start_codon:yes stop_codon:yes gene_type:complete
MAKRKRSTGVAASPAATDVPAIDRSKMRRSEVPLPPNVAGNASKPTRRQSSRGGAAAATNPNDNPDVLDGVMALRASPDGHECSGLESHLQAHSTNGTVNEVSASIDTNGVDVNANHTTASPLTADPPAKQNGKGGRKKAGTLHVKAEPVESNIATLTGAAENVTGPTEDVGMDGDPEAAEGLEEDEVEVKEALSRPPPVNSEYLPLPWKGRLGYVRIHLSSTHSATSLTNAIGLSQHLSPHREPSRIQFPNMPHREHPRASPSIEGPVSARARHQESPR